MLRTTGATSAVWCCNASPPVLVYLFIYLLTCLAVQTWKQLMHYVAAYEQDSKAQACSSNCPNKTDCVHIETRKSRPFHVHRSASLSWISGSWSASEPIRSPHRRRWRQRLMHVVSWEIRRQRCRKTHPAAVVLSASKPPHLAPSLSPQH